MNIHHFKFKLLCSVLLSILFISCSDNGVSVKKNDPAKPSATNNVASKSFNPPEYNHGPYIYGPLNLMEYGSGTFSMIPADAHNITWYYRDTSDYSFLEGGSGNEFSIYFIFRKDKEVYNYQISQIMAIFEQGGETKRAILNIAVTFGGAFDGDLFSEPFGEHDSILDDCNAENPEPEPCFPPDE